MLWKSWMPSAWCLEFSRNISLSRWKPRFSAHSKHVLGVSVSRTFSRASLKSTPARPLFQWMEWAHSTRFPMVPCSQDWSTWRRGSSCCFSCGCSIRSHHFFSSMTKLAKPTQSSKERAASKVTQQRAFRAIAGALQAGERLFAFLDDLYVSCQPARVAG